MAKDKNKQGKRAEMLKNMKRPTPASEKESGEDLEMLLMAEEDEDMGVEEQGGIWVGNPTLPEGDEETKPQLSDISDEELMKEMKSRGYEVPSMDAESDEEMMPEEEDNSEDYMS